MFIDTHILYHGYNVLNMYMYVCDTSYMHMAVHAHNTK